MATPPILSEFTESAAYTSFLLDLTSKKESTKKELATAVDQLFMHMLRGVNMLIHCQQQQQQQAFAQTSPPHMFPLGPGPGGSSASSPPQARSSPSSSSSLSAISNVTSSPFAGLNLNLSTLSNNNGSLEHNYGQSGNSGNHRHASSTGNRPSSSSPSKPLPPAAAPPAISSISAAAAAAAAASFLNGHNDPKSSVPIINSVLAATSSGFRAALNEALDAGFRSKITASAMNGGGISLKPQHQHKKGGGKESSSSSKTENKNSMDTNGNGDDDERTNGTNGIGSSLCSNGVLNHMDSIASVNGIFGLPPTGDIFGDLCDRLQNANAALINATNGNRSLLFSGAKKRKQVFSTRGPHKIRNNRSSKIDCGDSGDRQNGGHDGEMMNEKHDEKLASKRFKLSKSQQHHIDLPKIDLFANEKCANDTGEQQQYDENVEVEVDVEGLSDQETIVDEDVDEQLRLIIDSSNSMDCDCAECLGLSPPVGDATDAIDLRQSEPLVIIKTEESELSEHEQQASSNSTRRSKRKSRDRKAKKSTDSTGNQNNEDVNANGDGEQHEPLDLKRSEASADSPQSPTPISLASLNLDPSSSKMAKKILMISLRCTEDECDRLFTNKIELENHLLVEHSIKPNRCLVKGCGLSFDSTVDLSAHIISEHRPRLGARWHCALCPRKVWPNYSQLAQHHAWCHRPGHYRCGFKYCNFMGTFPRQLKQHQWEQHQRFACNDCGERFSTQQKATSHQRVHMGVKNFRCIWPDCGYGSERRACVARHVRILHFKLPSTIKMQTAMGIRDDRDPLEWVRDAVPGDHGALATNNNNNNNID